ncbi:hypothetical protein THAOC_20022, partial [Thalassiosira oceanica]
VNEHWIALLCNVPLLEAARRAADISTAPRAALGSKFPSHSALRPEVLILTIGGTSAAAFAEPVLARSDKTDLFSARMSLRPGAQGQVALKSCCCYDPSSP